jgi:GT2 family glycosyltransferase
MPRVTTVVMTRNRWSDLARTLPRHPGPVVVVDNGSDDGTPELVERHFPRVEVVRLRANRGAVARNVGVRHARTPYVAFADDDSWWELGALDVAVSHLDRSPRLGLLTGRVLVGEDDRPDAVSMAQAASPLGREPDLPGPSVLGFLACAAVVRRDAFLSVGGFDDVVQMYGEETRLAWDLRAAGWGIAYVPDVLVHHHPSTSGRSPGSAAQLERNRLLTILMRRPWPVIAREVSVSLRSPLGRAGLRTALPRVPRALLRRRRLPSTVECEVRRLESDQGAQDLSESPA